MSPLALIMLSAGTARAGLLEETCDHLYQTLGSGPYERLTKSTGDFSSDSSSYRGCIVRLAGDVKTMTVTQRPEGLFGTPLPYCPDGKLPADSPPGFRNKEGWCGDRMADGPDGTSYRAIKQGVFCIVEGNWDGGDDSDPDYVPLSRYSVIVKCASTK